MGTCNTLRTTETYTTENFTLIQLEEERQKLKKKELLKNMLTDGEFSIKGQCAINLMMTKLEIINTFLLMKYNRSFIQMTTGRLKSYDSVCKKMQKKELDLNFAQALEKINDLIGVRAVCSYVDDIYKVAELIEKQQDIHIINSRMKASGSKSNCSFAQPPWITGQISIISFAIKEVRNRPLSSTRNYRDVLL